MTDKTDKLEQRVTELEEKFVFQAETIDSLNDIVTRQWTEIDRLTRRLKDLDDQMYALENETGGAPAHQRPPHY